MPRLPVDLCADRIYVSRPSCASISFWRTRRSSGTIRAQMTSPLINRSISSCHLDRLPVWCSECSWGMRRCAGCRDSPCRFAGLSLGGAAKMTDDKFRRDYGQHLIEQVNKGQMTRRQLLVRASVFGFSATAAGSLLAACGGDDGGTAASPSASGAPAPVMGGTLTGIIPPSITDIDPVTIYDQGGIVLIQQVCEYLIALDDTERAEAQPRRELVGQRRRVGLDLQAAPGRHVQRRQPLRGRRRGGQHRARRRSQERLRGPGRSRPASSRRAAPRRSTRPPSSSPSTSRSPTSRIWCASRPTTPSCCRAPTTATS